MILNVYSSFWSRGQQTIAHGPNLTMACLCMGPGGRMAFTFLKGCKKYKEVSAIEAICGPENLKYLLSALYKKSLLISVLEWKAQVVQIEATILLNKNCLSSNESVGGYGLVLKYQRTYIT